MTFFYHSTGGMADFIILLAICLLAIIFGQRLTRILALSALAYFFCDRMALWIDFKDWQLAIATSLYGLFFASVAVREKQLASYGFSGLIALRVLTDTFMYFGAIDLDGANEIATAIGYLQLLIISGGIANDASGGRLQYLYGLSTGLRGRRIVARMGASQKRL